jgi:hypothetical protein
MFVDEGKRADTCGGIDLRFRVNYRCRVNHLGHRLSQSSAD